MRALLLVPLLLGCRAAELPTIDEPAPAEFVVAFASLDPGEGRAYVSIFRDDPDLGPMRLARIHRVGERIGCWPDGGPEPTGRHAAYSPLKGSVVRANWDTGWILKAVREGEHRFKTQACPRGADPCPGPETTELLVPVLEAVYGPPEGPDLPYRVPRRPLPPDGRCPAHGPK